MPFRYALLSFLVAYNLPLHALEKETEKDDEVLIIKGNRYALNHFAELNTTNSHVDLLEKGIAPHSVLDAIIELPGIAENGQAGLFQVYSIRGVSRQRVLTYIDQVPLKAERRAGVATSFLHPMLFESVAAIRGPASTIFFSGSLGGTVKLIPRFFNRTQLMLGYDSVGNRNHQLIGTAGEDWSLGIGRQSANRAKDVEGSLLNDAYDQYSLSFIKEWKFDNFDLSWTNLASYGEDIGRSSTRFPEQIVTVPVERHWLSQLVFDADSWKFSLFTHPNKIQTETIRPANRINLATNQSDDIGLGFKQLLFFSNDSLESEWGFDYLHRVNIEATDLRRSLVDNSAILTHSLSNAQESEIGVYATLSDYWGGTKWQIGSRIIHHRVKNASGNSIVDDAIIGFVGLSHSFKNDLYFTANLGTGVRFPTVSERFFAGTTGRGEVMGNPNLDKETNHSLDLGLKFRNNGIDWAFNLYWQKIDNYIERIEIATELLSFRNLQDGIIHGVEFESSYKLADTWNLQASLSSVKGEDERGNPLIDIPSNRLTLKSNYEFNKWQWIVDLDYRQHKNKVAFSERRTPSTLVVDTSATYELQSDLKISFSIGNLLDRRYYNSQDELVPLAHGRSFGLSLSWLME